MEPRLSTTRQIMDYLPPGRQGVVFRLKGSAAKADTPFQVGRKLSRGSGTRG